MQSAVIQTETVDIHCFACSYPKYINNSSTYSHKYHPTTSIKSSKSSSSSRDSHYKTTPIQRWHSKIPTNNSSNTTPSICSCSTLTKISKLQCNRSEWPTARNTKATTCSCRRSVRRHWGTKCCSDICRRSSSGARSRATTSWIGTKWAACRMCSNTKATRSGRRQSWAKL